MKHIFKIIGLFIIISVISKTASAQVYFSGNTVAATGSALGGSNTATGYRSFVAGSASQATQSYNFAAGYLALATGGFSYSIGSVSTSSGYNSFSIGNRASSTGTNGYSFGYYATSSATNAYSFGYYAYATGVSSFSIGNYNTAAASNSFAFGEYLSTSTSNNMTIGRGISSGTKLNNGITNSLMVGFNSDIPTLYVGASAGTGTTGDVGIGTTNTNGYKLAVKGDIIAEEVVVKLYASWPDYVFGEKYNLKSLEEVEDFIDENNHLPNVPSEAEVKEGGINLGEMDAILLQKIEELTLYTIKQQKLIEEQGKLIKELSKKGN